MDLLSPKIDVVFRKVLGSESNTDILVSLLNSILSPAFVVTSVEIKNPYNLATYVGSKESIVDIKARDQTGRLHNVEMQLDGTILYGKRAVYYLSQMVVDQLKQGMDYSDINTTIGIHLLDFKLFNDDRYIRRFALRDMETCEYHEQLGCFHLIFVELPKFDVPFDKLATPLEGWITVFNHGHTLSPDSLPPALAVEPGIVRAVHELARMAMSPREREIYEAEVKARMLDKGQLLYAREEGRVEGRVEEGRRLLYVVGRKRLGEPSDAVRKTIDRLDDADRIEALVERLFSVESWDDLLLSV